MSVSRPVLLLLCLQWGGSAGFLAPGHGHAACAAPHTQGVVLGKRRAARGRQACGHAFEQLSACNDGSGGAAVRPRTAPMRRDRACSRLFR